MGIRMSSNQFTYNYNRSLQNAYKRQTKLFEDADGGSLHRPSDNSVDYNKLLHYKNNLSENNQYQDNVNTALSWMKTSDNAMIHITEIMKTFVTKSVHAANDDNNETDWNAIAKEMEAHIQEIVATANNQEGDRYVFSGQRDLIQPFVWNRGETGSVAKISRGLAKNLDNFQVNFFKNDESKNIDTNAVLNQMLTLKDNDGNIFYLDTTAHYDSSDTTKSNPIYYFYDKDFMDTDYKAIYNSGQSKVDPARDAAGKLVLETDSDTGAAKPFLVSDYFNNQGAIKTEEVDDGNGGTTTVNKFVNVQMKNGSTSTMNFATITQSIVNYAGDLNYFSMVKLNGAPDPESDTVNVNGKDLFGTDIFDNAASGNEPSGCALINDMLTVLAKTESHDNHWMSSDGITIANVADSTMIIAQTHLGARSQLYTNVLDMLENQNDNITENITNVSSTDVAKLAVDLMQAQTLYSMSLSLGGRILPLSLADYL